MGKRILIFSSREICYFSSNFFANEMATAFEELGNEVFVCELAMEDDLDQKLTPYVDQEYDLILDFNSLLPRMEMDDHSLLVNHFKGPFVDWLVDHPLFHHVALSADIKDSYALCLDETQKTYVETFYPNVKKTLMLPLSASESFVPVEKSKEARVLFTGTFEIPENVAKLINQEEPERKNCMWKLIEMRLADPNLPMEDAFCIYLKEKGMELSKKEFREEMNRMYAVDVYVRNYFRNQVIEELLNNRIPMRAIGHGWEKLQHPNKDCIICEEPVFFNLSFEKIAKEHILLNVAPIFHHGVHDRVFAGMANHTVVLTEENPYITEHFDCGRELCTYNLMERQNVADLAEELLLNPTKRREIEETAYASYQKKHTWKERARFISMQL